MKCNLFYSNPVNDHLENKVSDEMSFKLQCGMEYGWDGKSRKKDRSRRWDGPEDPAGSYSINVSDRKREQEKRR